jgi:hypothetical protein
MSSVTMSPPVEAEDTHDAVGNDDKHSSGSDELRMNLAQLKIGEGCQRRARLLGGAACQNYETYSLPVSRVCFYQ